MRNLRIIVVLALLAVHVASLCPANGNTHVLYATTNMGNNIASFDTMGKYIGEVINSSSMPEGFRIDKLRNMVFGPDGNLYVSSARGVYSSIFALSGNGVLNHTLNADCTRNFLFEVASLSNENPYMDHPYSFLFHPEDQSIYVSNQNSVTVTRYKKTSVISSPHLTWAPGPLSQGVLTGHAASDSYLKPGTGLFVSPSNTRYVLNSVRGIALSPLLSRDVVEGAAAGVNQDATQPTSYVNKCFYLAVADLVSNAILVFDADNGRYLFTLSVPSPVQIAFPRVAFSSSPDSAPFIYVTSKDDGMLYKIPFRVGGDKHVAELSPKSPGHSLSGIYENSGHGVLYVGDRNGRKVAVYSTPLQVGTRKTQDGKKEAVEGTDFLGYFHVDLPDQPEFLLLTQVELQQNLPHCYELESDGSLRYTALCMAVNFWAGVCLLGVVTALALYLGKIVSGKGKEVNDEAQKKKERVSRIQAEAADENTTLVPPREKSSSYGTAVV